MINNVCKAIILLLSCFTFQSWAEKMQFQGQITQYFSDVPRHVSAIVRAMAPADTLLNVYRMTGYLVKHCAKLIYVRVGFFYGPELLNQILDYFNCELWASPHFEFRRIFMNPLVKRKHSIYYIFTQYRSRSESLCKSSRTWV